MDTHSLSQTYTWSSEMGDYIGMESCVDLQQIGKVVVHGGCTEEDECCRRRDFGKRVQRWVARNEKKEYPPPIPWLARSEESVPSQMPWVLKRYHTGDGRLIIREEKLTHHEYFRAERSEGRLTLQLVHLDEDSPAFGDDEEEREEDHNNVESSNLDEDHHDEDGDQCKGGTTDGGDEITKDRNFEEGVAMRLLPESVESGTVVMCCNYSGVRSNPCLFGMPVPAMKPVHI